ncbi:putative het domain protein [Botrytis fragariae]|uniref:Putative het domain protein n=1 Tax=Botrytis fragariae TaxID=1964551 RepID=A0A8H6AYM3_9HELO|nr:putative het domain protein [Botrytis fragariae]KAF5876203.1 putative het domain protein [Botrytis fragariae]
MDMRFDVCAGEDYEGRLGEGRFGNEEEKKLPVDRVKNVPICLDGKNGLEGVKKWMIDCGMDHEICRAVQRVKSLPKRLIRISIDVEVAPILIETSGLASIDYLALSARSFVGTPNIGESPTRENFSILETTGKSLDTSSLPKALTDAFVITRRLGYEYIYIAALCHVSDDPLDLIAIFAQATLLLSADNVSSPTEGLIQDRAIFNSPPLGINKDRYLRLSCLRNHADLDSSPLSTSGWAFIERILAPRILHFTKRQLIWECASGWKFEASNVEDKQYGSGMIRGTYQKNLTQPYIKEYLSRETRKTSESSTQENNNTQISNLREYAQRLEVWYQIIDTISTTTFPSQLDKSKALSLLTKIIDNNTFGTNLSGIFTQNIAYGLAWGRVNTLLTPNPDAQAPSWSWGSVHGPISHMYNSYPPSILHMRSAHPSWTDKHTPELLSHTASPLPVPTSNSLPNNPVLGLELKASLTRILHLCEHFQSEFPKYTVNLVLDQSPIFDCKCCGPRSDAVQETGIQEFEKRKDHYFAMYVSGDLDVEAGDGDPWKVSRCADMLVLRMVDGREEMGGCEDEGEGVAGQGKTISGDGGMAVYERVGLLRLSFTSYEKNSVDEGSIQEKFDGVGWDRKTIRLV